MLGEIILIKLDVIKKMTTEEKYKYMLKFTLDELLSKFIIFIKYMGG